MNPNHKDIREEVVKTLKEMEEQLNFISYPKIEDSQFALRCAEHKGKRTAYIHVVQALKNILNY